MINESGYTLADLLADPVVKEILVSEVTLRINSGNGKVRNIGLTLGNAEWCVKHYGHYLVPKGGMYPYMHAVDRVEDGIGMPELDCHLSVAIEAYKPEGKEEGEEHENGR